MSSSVSSSFEKHKNFSMLICVLILVLDFYVYYYAHVKALGLSHWLVDRFVLVLAKTGLYNSPYYTKYIVIVLIGFFTLLDRGKKDIELDKKWIVAFIVLTTLIFLSTGYIVHRIDSLFIFAGITLVSFLYLIKAYSYFSRLLEIDIMKDRFNKKNKVFEQNTALIENDMSVNIPYRFIDRYKDNKPIYKNGHINLIALERAIMILGKPGSGKSYSFVEEIIRQHIIKGFAMVNYDYKFPTLTKISYNYFNRYRNSYDKYPNKGRFSVLNLDDPQYSHRCNPLSKEILTTKAEAVDAVYTLFFNIDKKSATKQDFFQMSAMSITAAALWFLRMYQDGKYCSLPHLIEFINRPDDELLVILDSYDELRYFTSSFSDALQKESFEQLSGQTASARIPLGKCATDQMFWVMAPQEQDHSIDLRVNMHDNVTVLNVANNPLTQKTNGPALGLFMSQAAKLVNAQNRVPCDFLVDELPTVFINGLDNLIATARSNKVCTVLAMQDYTQIVSEYGKEQADKIFNTTDNIVCGKVAIDTAEKVSKAIGKFNYRNQSVTISKDSTSTSFNTQREYVVPPEDISQFTQGEFVGVVSDTYNQPIEIKSFRGIVSPDKSDLTDLEVPKINPGLTTEDLTKNRIRIQNDVTLIVKEELDRIENVKAEELETVQEHKHISQALFDDDQIVLDHDGVSGPLDGVDVQDIKAPVADTEVDADKNKLVDLVESMAIKKPETKEPKEDLADATEQEDNDMDSLNEFNFIND